MSQTKPRAREVNVSEMTAHPCYLRLPVKCWSCGATGEVPTAWLGCTVSCRRCGNQFTAGTDRKPVILGGTAA
jgi:uncharacterized paraquat-inducible protein A